MVAAVATAAAVVLAGCGSSGTSIASSSSAASPSSASAATCRAADDVQKSLVAVKDVDVVNQGTDALRQALTGVQSALSQFAEAAKGQYAGEVSQIRDDAAAVRTAVDAAVSTPNTDTVGKVATAASALGQDAQRLVTEVKNTC